jgi:hypothetical protein
MPTADTRGLLFTTVMLGFMAMTLAGAVLHSEGLLIVGGLVGYLAAMVHGIYFCVLTFRRKRAWQLAGATRVIHACAIGGLGLAVALNLILVLRYIEPARATMVVAWAMAILVLAYRAWMVPSPRRAGVLQLVAVVVAVPSIFVQVVSWSLSTSVVVQHQLDTSLFVYFIAVAASGPVLHRLFASRPDPDEAVLPSATAKS